MPIFNLWQISWTEFLFRNFNQLLATYMNNVRHILLSYLFVAYLSTFCSNVDYLALNERVISAWWIGKDLEWNGCRLILRCYPSICLKKLRKTTKNLGQDSRSPGRGLNAWSPEYETGVLNTLLRPSFHCLLMWTNASFYGKKCSINVRYKRFQ
jgi:hypothetical protein